MKRVKVVSKKNTTMKQKCESNSGFLSIAFSIDLLLKIHSYNQL